MPKKIKPKKPTAWTKHPYLSVSVDDGQKCILHDIDEVFDFIRNTADIEWMKKPSETRSIEISVVMLTDKQMDNLPDWGE